MSVYPPKSGKTPYWTYAFTLRGVRFRGSTRRTTREEAELEEARLRLEAETAHARGLRGTLLSEIFARYWLERGQHEAAADTTFYQLENLRDGLGDILVKDIPDGLLARYVAKRRGQKTRRKTLPAPATINREIELLRRVVLRARDAWGVDIGRAPKWGKHKLAEPDERVRALSVDEEMLLIKAVRPDFRPLILFSMLAGVRLANAIGLTWAAVDDGRNVITMKVKSKKAGGRNHVIPITPEIATVLNGERGAHPIYVFTYLCERPSKNRRRGERYPFSKTGWRRPWKAALKAAGIEDYRWHDNRHTAGTRLLAATGNLKLTQQFLGHASIVTTTKYAHVDVEDLRAAMIKVSEKVSDLRGAVARKRRNIKAV